MFSLRARMDIVSYLYPWFDCVMSCYTRNMAVNGVKLKLRVLHRVVRGHPQGLAGIRGAGASPQLNRSTSAYLNPVWRPRSERASVNSVQQQLTK